MQLNLEEKFGRPGDKIYLSWMCKAKKKFFNVRLLNKGDHQKEPVDSTAKELCSIYLLSCYTA
jgi:hypothetical protein